MLDEAGVIAGLEVVDERVRQQQLASEMFHQVLAVHDGGAVEDIVHLVEVALHDGGAGDLLHLPRGRQVLVAGLAVVFPDTDELAAEFAAQLIEVKHDRKARSVPDEQAAFPVVDVAARARHEDAPLVLHPLGVAMTVAVEQLLIGEATGQGH